MHNSYYDSCSGSEDTKFCISLKTSSDASGFNKRSIFFAGQNASFGDCQYDQLVFVSRLCADLMLNRLLFQYLCKRDIQTRLIKTLV